MTEIIIMLIRFDKIRVNIVDLLNKCKRWKIVSKIRNNSSWCKDNYIDCNKF